MDIEVQETVEALREWMANDKPKLPDELGEAALYWLRQTEPESGSS